MAVLNIGYCEGAGKAGSSDDWLDRRPVPIFGPFLYNAAGDGRLVSNTADIIGADKIEIPAEALAVDALIFVKVISGSAYVITGIWSGAADNIAAGQGEHISEGFSTPIEIGRTPAGVMHTHLLIFGA